MRGTSTPGCVNFLAMFDSSLPIRADVPLAPLTTFRVGGSAEFFGEPKTLDELRGLLDWAHNEGKTVTLLGAGANVLIADEGVPGIVLRLQNNNVQIPNLNDQTNPKSQIPMIAGAGVGIGALLGFCLENSLSGLEFLAGIPGSVGGAIFGNAGGWNQSIGDFVLSVTVVDPITVAVSTLTHDACRFRYRTSRFKETGEIVWAATFGLTRADPDVIRRAMKEKTAHKTATQPIRLPSAGCVFMNYEIAVEEVARLRAVGIPEEFLARRNIPAGWLIEHAGLKGIRVGDIEVSQLHGSFLVNHGAGTATDIVTLMDRERRAVREKFGVELRSEIRLLGFDSH